LLRFAVNERQVQRVLDDYRRCYNRTRTPLSLKKEAPADPACAVPTFGRVASVLAGCISGMIGLLLEIR
jgi:hypothetical protein